MTSTKFEVWSDARLSHSRERVALVHIDADGIPQTASRLPSELSAAIERSYRLSQSGGEIALRSPVLKKDVNYTWSKMLPW